MQKKLPKVWENSDNFVICFIMPENVLKCLKTRKHGLLLTYRGISGMIVIFFIPRLMRRSPGIPVKNGRGKGKELRQTNHMSKGYKGIRQTYIIILCCFWIIHSIEMSCHNIIITPFIMVWEKIGLDRNPKIWEKWFDIVMVCIGNKNVRGSRAGKISYSTKIFLNCQIPSKPARSSSKLV